MSRSITRYIALGMRAEVRCPDCNKLFYKDSNPKESHYIIELKCPRCGVLTEFNK